MGAVYVGTVKLDGKAKPRRIEMRFDAGPELVMSIREFTN